MSIALSGLILWSATTGSVVPIIVFTLLEILPAIGILRSSVPRHLIVSRDNLRCSLHYLSRKYFQELASHICCPI